MFQKETETRRKMTKKRLIKTKNMVIYTYQKQRDTKKEKRN